MGRITSGLFISLDGVAEAPDQWHFDYFNDEMGAAVGAQIQTSNAILLGRVTYQGFADYWPHADPNDPFTAIMNDTPKYVVSNTLTDVSAWQNSTLVSGDVNARLAELKKEQNLGITGSLELTHRLLADGLLDELHLMIHPLVLGKGQKLFPDGPKVPLALQSSTTFSTGVVYSVYGPAAG